MHRTWRQYAWTGHAYALQATFRASGPQDALQHARLTAADGYTITASRSGYGHHTGRVEVRAPETVAATTCKRYPLPADFLLLAD